MNKKNSMLLLDLTQGAMIAALYVVLTFIANLAGLASGVIQVRLSEALTILPVFTAAAVPGLAVGCVLANLLTGCAIWDVVFGSLATLIGAVGTRLLRKKSPVLAVLPPILSNIIIVPLVLQRVYGVEDAYWYLAMSPSDIPRLTTKAPCEAALMGECHVRVEISDFVMPTLVLF